VGVSLDGASIDRKGNGVAVDGHAVCVRGRV